MSALVTEPTRIVASEAKRRARLGFLGVGWIGRNRLEAIAKSGCAEIVVIADSSQALAEEVARSIAKEPASCLEKPLEKPAVVLSLTNLFDYDLDGIVIATPSALHAEQSIAALDRGLAVFCQKPLGRNKAETATVVAAARRNNRLLSVDLSYRFLEGTQKLRRLVQCKELGEIYAVELAFHNAYGPDKSWFYDTKHSGGGCVIDLGIHLIDLAMWILGCRNVTRVESSLYTKGSKLRTKDIAEDYATALVDLTCGTSLQISCSWKLPAGYDAKIVAAFYGTKGGAILKNVDGSFYDFVAYHSVGTKAHRLTSPPENWGGRAAIRWTQQLASGNQFDLEIESLVDVAGVLDRIYESCR